MEFSSFFNAKLNEHGAPDRIYTAESYANYFSSFISNGVFPNPATGLQVVSIDNNMIVRVKEGKAWIHGYFYHNTDDLILQLEPADGVLQRVDSIVVRLDFLNREIKTYIKKGDFSSLPKPKTLQRDLDAYELCLAYITVENGVLSIQQSKITDTKLNSSLCGIVSQTINEIDTTTLFKQLEAHIQEKSLDMSTYLKGAKEYFNTWLTENKENFSKWLSDTKMGYDSEFNTWFDTIKNILDGDVAGNLLNKINSNASKIEELKKKTNIVVTDNPNIERQPGSFYFIVTDTQSGGDGSTPSGDIKVSPSMGIKVI